VRRPGRTALDRDPDRIRPVKRSDGPRRKTVKALIGFMTAAVMVVSLLAQDTRPVRDDVGFCWSPAGMKTLVEFLDRMERENFEPEGLVAAIAPHDDYLFAGRVDYPLFKVLRAKEVVVFGVTHATVRKEIGDPHEILILDEFKQWPGLGEPVAISGLREYLKERLDKKLYIVSNKAHTLEHSIESEVPWLQYFNPGVKITPIMVTGMPLEKMDEVSTKLADVIVAYMKDNGLAPGKDVFFLISADGNHYGQDFDNSAFGEGEPAWTAARALDQRIIRECLTGPMDKGKVESLTKKLWGKTYLDYGNVVWCGKYSIPFGLLTTEKVIAAALGKNLSGMLFRYSDTFSEGVLAVRKTGMGTTAPFSLRHWVSFCSIGYYLE
jgi:AmmeMemoRadiSam system protein B